MTTVTPYTADQGSSDQAPLDQEPANQGSANQDSASQAGLRTYFSLFKPRVMSLVVFTGFVGLWMAPGEISILTAIIAIACIAANAGAAGAINMWYDADIDALMERTAERAIPRGKVLPETALYLGMWVSLVSALVMGFAVNWVAAGLLVAANLYYVILYTMWLKRRSAQNIVIGGGAGAFPPMIGWAAVTGGLDWTPVALFLLIFMWTPPHFWGLALYRMGDYGKAQVPMLPNIAGRFVTRIHILVYCVLLLPISLAPYFLETAGILYAIGTGVLSTVFLILGIQLFLKDDDGKARALFGLSIAYLFLVFGLLVLDGRAVEFTSLI